MAEDTGSLVKEFLKQKVFAVVGASRDPKKYGHQIYLDLKKKGYTVYPVNPNAVEILGDRCYPDLTSLPKKPDVVDIVTPPKITEKVVRECKKLGLRRIWMQPGSESDSALTFCKENNMKVIHGLCVMAKSQHLKNNR